MGRFLDCNYNDREVVKDIVLTKFNKFSEIKAHKVTIELHSLEDQVRISLYRKEEPLCFFAFTAFPNNFTIAVSTSTFVYPRFRNLGVGTALQKVKKKVCKALAIQMLLATVNVTNESEIHILKKHGWKIAGRTNTVYLFAKTIKTK